MVKLDTMTGTGKAMVNTPAKAQRAPIIMPGSKSKRITGIVDSHRRATITCIGSRNHIAIADCGHRYDGPPKPFRDAFEIVVRIDLETLGIVDEAGEDNYSEDEEKDE